jgi:hypothetical protein
MVPLIRAQVWVAGLVSVAVVAGLAPAATAPSPCGGAAQIADLVGDGHHRNSDVTGAWISGAAGRLQAVIRVRTGMWSPAHDDSEVLGIAMLYDMDGVTRYVRARVGRSGTASFDAGTWSATGYFASTGSTTGALANDQAEGSPGTVTIDLPGDPPVRADTVIRGPWVITYDGDDGSTPHWVDRAPGGTGPAESAVGGDVQAGACLGLVGSGGVTGVSLEAPAARRGAGRVALRGAVAGAPGGTPVTISITGAGSVATASAITGPDGAFTASPRIGEAVTVRASAGGFASGSRSIRMRSAVLAPHVIVAGARARIRTDPPLPGRVLALRPGDFRPLSAGPARAGRATLALPAATRGRLQFVFIPAGARAERATSRVITIR